MVAYVSQNPLLETPPASFDASNIKIYNLSFATVFSSIERKMTSKNSSNGLEDPSSDFLELLRTAGDPSSSKLTLDGLASSLGMNGLPSKEDIFDQLEKDILAPVRDLSSEDIGRWQV